MLTASVAYLRPGPFHNTEADADSMDTTAFVQFIDRSFETFIENGATNLILDLRDNPGGDNSFSDPVIAWFADRPFRFSSNFRVKVSPESTAANQARLEANPDASESTSQLYKKLYAASENGEVVLFTIPETKPRTGQAFEGKVFILVNRYSFSNAVSAAALIQDYGFGVIMGEQTVDMATTYGAMERFTLPETGIVMTYPKALIVRSSGDDKVGPIIPDVTLPAPRIRGATDVMLQAALKQVESEGPMGRKSPSR
jgi:C-terminal processing protease CtpA/Prc